MSKLEHEVRIVHVWMVWVCCVIAIDDEGILLYDSVCVCYVCYVFAGVVIPADVLQKVCSIAEREEKPNQPVMLAALLLCKPPSSKVPHLQL